MRFKHLKRFTRVGKKSSDVPVIVAAAEMFVYVDSLLDALAVKKKQPSTVTIWKKQTIWVDYAFLAQQKSILFSLERREKRG